MQHSSASAAAAASWSAAAAGGVALPAAAAVSYAAMEASRIEFEQLIDLVGKCDGTATDPALVRLMPHVKGWLRGHDELAPLGVELLLSRLRSPQALVRINLVRVVDALFMRSRAFRSALLDHFSSFLQLAVGIGPGAHTNQPKPPDKAKHLQMLSVSCVRNWNDSFGDSLQLLRLGCDFMQARVGGMHVPTQFESEQAAEARLAYRRQRTQRLLAVRYARLVAEFESQESELQGTLSEISNALEILFPRSDDAQQLGDYMLRDKTENDTQLPAELEALKQEPDDGLRPAKRAKHDDAAMQPPSLDEGAPEAQSHINEAADSHAFSLGSPPAVADSALDDVEWEEEGSGSLAAAASAPPAAPATAAPPHPPSSPPPSSVAPAATALEGAAAAFGEYPSADSHWWLDDEQDDAQMMEGDEAALGDDGEQDGEWVDEHKDGGDSTADNQMTHGIGRNYSLDIEFDAHVAVENQDTAPVFEALREAWARIEKSFLPLLTEWIDTLSRIELEQADLSALAAGKTASSAATATATLSESQLQTLRSQRDSYLKRCVQAREQIHTLRVKCARLGVRISSHTAERNATVRRETEYSMTSAVGDDAPSSAAAAAASDAGAVASPSSSLSSSRRSAAASSIGPSSSVDVAAQTRHAAGLLSRRAAAEKRALTKIRTTKRKHAQEVEAKRVAARQQQPTEGEEAASRVTGDPLRRPFSAAGRAAAAAATSSVKSEPADQGEYL